MAFNPNQLHQNNIEQNLRLPKIDSSLPVQERLDQLFKSGVLDISPEGKKYILQTLSRIAVIANINGIKIPFYQSSTGTDGKNTDHWYPFFGNKGNWLIKGRIQDMNNGYDIPELKKMMVYLDTTLPEYLYKNILTPDQEEVFENSVWKKFVGKKEEVKELHKDFIINQEEAAEYMAKILNYDLKDVPDEGAEKNLSLFLERILDSMKKRLEIIRKM